MREIDKKLDDAIGRAELEEVKRLVEAGADIECRDPFGCTPLMNASWVASVEIVSYLLKLGADPTSVNNDGLTAKQMVESIGHNDYGHDDVLDILSRLEPRNSGDSLLNS